VMHISSSNRVVLPRIRLNFLSVEMLSVSFCPFQSFSTIACVRGERVPMLSDVLVVIDGVILAVACGK